jgi:hypothetical protein
MRTGLASASKDTTKSCKGGPHESHARATTARARTTDPMSSPSSPMHVATRTSISLARNCCTIRCCSFCVYRAHRHAPFTLAPGGGGGRSMPHLAFGGHRHGLGVRGGF